MSAIVYSPSAWPDIHYRPDAGRAHPSWRFTSMAYRSMAYFTFIGAVGVEMGAEAAAEERRGAHLPEQPVQRLGAGPRKSVGRKAPNFSGK